MQEAACRTPRASRGRVEATSIGALINRWLVILRNQLIFYHFGVTCLTGKTASSTLGHKSASPEETVRIAAILCARGSQDEDAKGRRSQCRIRCWAAETGCVKMARRLGGLLNAFLGAQGKRN